METPKERTNQAQTRIHGITPSAFLRTLSTIVTALIAGQIIFMAVAYVIVSGEYISLQPGLAPVLLLAFIAAAGVAALVGQVIFMRLIMNARVKLTLQEKMVRFQNATIIRYAGLEAGGIMAVVGYLITGHLLFPVVLLAILVLQILLFPTMEQTIQVLKLPLDERETLRQNKPWPQEVS